MRVISRRSLREFWAVRSQADSSVPLRQWYAKTLSAQWNTPADVKRTFGGNVDFVKVRSGSTLAVFDRLIAAIHYDFGRVFVLRVMTHREYDLDHWKREL